MPLVRKSPSLSSPDCGVGKGCLGFPVVLRHAAGLCPHSTWESSRVKSRLPTTHPPHQPATGHPVGRGCCSHRPHTSDMAVGTTSAVHAGGRFAAMMFIAKLVSRWGGHRRVGWWLSRWERCCLMLQLLRTGFLSDAGGKEIPMDSLSLCGPSFLLSPGRFLPCPVLLLQ